ncbi:MAG TPA: SpoVG family protein [Sedimentisphaerales bacterium]|nr:SpoVG family protein [Sedimentisphaerales bacterium]
MKITEVRVNLVSNKNSRLKAFCSVTMDNEFVVRDIKVIEGAGGHFVAMPSRKMTDHCGKCGGKNHLRAKFCNNCGASLSGNRARKDVKGRMKLHADIAHPINLECRKRIQGKVISAFKEEMEKSRQSGYKPVEMEEPVKMDKPAEMDEPVEMDKPDEMDEPVKMDEPDEMDEPDDEVPEIIS